MKTKLHIVSLRHRAGMEVMFLNYLEYIYENFPEELDNHVVLALNLNSDIEATLNGMNIKYYNYSSTSKFNLKFIPFLKNILTENKIEVVHSHNYGANIYAGISSLLNRNLKIITHCHGTKSFIRTFKSKLLSKFWIRRSDVIICNSKATQITMNKFFSDSLNGKNMKVIYNGVPVRKKIKDVEKDPNNLIFIGRMVEMKSPETVIHMMEELCRIKPDVTLDMLGDGELFEKLSKTIKELSLTDKVKMHGNVDNVDHYLAKSSLLILPSIREPLGNVIIEAAFQQTPTIGTDAEGIPEVIINGKTGLTIEPTLDFTSKNFGFVVDVKNEKIKTAKRIDPIVLASQVNELLNQRNYLNSLGENAKNRAHNKFSMENYYMRISEVHE